VPIDHVKLPNSDLDASRAFHEAAMAAGGQPNGPPGERPYGYYYAAFVLDPDGQNIEAVYHGDRRQ
jgi:predicted lactoylglutathione lyase